MNSDMVRVAAVVVTYNRVNLLRECINALLNQTFKPANIYVINNASTDETEEYLGKMACQNSSIRFITLPENIGGAGGFSKGVADLYMEYDYLWLMDDDTIPDSDCLQNMVNALTYLEKPSFLASYVYSIEGQPMNTPGIATSQKANNGYGRCLRQLENKLVEIEYATFVSILIPSDAVKAVGYPCSFFFIWGDDIEYTRRLAEFYGSAYVVGDSKALHKRAGGSNLSIIDENNINRIKFYRYNVRNSLIISKEYLSKKDHYKNLRSRFRTILRVVFKKTTYKTEKLMALCNGLIDYIFKRYDAHAFKDRLNIR